MNWTSCQCHYWTVNCGGRFWSELCVCEEILLQFAKWGLCPGGLCLSVATSVAFVLLWGQARDNQWNVTRSCLLIFSLVIRWHFQLMLCYAISFRLGYLLRLLVVTNVSYQLTHYGYPPFFSCIVLVPWWVVEHLYVAGENIFYCENQWPWNQYMLDSTHQGTGIWENAGVLQQEFYVDLAIICQYMHKMVF